MAYGFLDIAMTPSVRTAQAAMGAAEQWGSFQGNRAFDRFTDRETTFIAERDSFYMATVSETGWPYVQHRGGAPGFLLVVDDQTLAFADYRGNRQYLSVGNLGADGRASLILVDYPARRRLKIFARVEIVALDAAPALAAQLAGLDEGAVPERIMLLHLEAFDWNCPQHITPRFTKRQIAEAVRPLYEKVGALEAENASLRAMLAGQQGPLKENALSGVAAASDP